VCRSKHYVQNINVLLLNSKKPKWQPKARLQKG